MERTLLLVDDEENITSALARLLRQDGYTILRANSGQGGLDLLTRHEVGVIISDQRMPGMTGVEFLSKVKELHPDTVRIVLSGYTELNSVTEAINRGAVYKFLTKPWEDALLQANVDEAFSRYEMKLENARLNRELQKANEELLRINQGLELRVAGDRLEMAHSLKLLLVSQEILECLPLAVIGIGDDGMIAAANQMAHRMFGADGTRALLGEAASGVIPAELLNCIALGERPEQGSKKLRLADGREISYWYNPMGEISTSRGVILACAPDTLTH